ncbi:MAG: secondary thiamine-phosphate synthase enzyme YjbQ [bacterium]
MLKKKLDKSSLVCTKHISVSSNGFTDIIDITNQVESAVVSARINEGLVTVFVPGSTAGITTVEYESGLIEDLKEMFERLAPSNITYHHDARWGDGNGSAHVRAALLGAEKTFPFSDGRLTLGTWQQIILIDFDNRPRSRKIILKIVGV